MPPLPRLLTVAISATAFWLGTAGAQQTVTRGIYGTVTDKSTGKPVAGARILISGFAREGTTDSLGRYEILGIRNVISRVTVIANPSPPLNFGLDFGPRIRVERLLELDSTAVGRAQTLASVEVTAPAVSTSYRLTGFERRRVSGRG